MIKRVLLFVATNLAVMLLLGIVLNVVLPLLGFQLGDTSGLLVIAAVFGMGGAFVSLLMSKWIARITTGAQVITEPRNTAEQWLLGAVHELARAAGIGTPDVAIYDAPEINAFATGADRNNALVAVSTGLLGAMDRDEALAVLGHEITHVANGDMVTMALLQGVLNTFVILLSRLVGRVIDGALGGDREGRGGIGYFVTVVVLELSFGLLASLIVMAFSRSREFRADAGGAQLAGRDRMISALQRLAQTYGENTLPKAIQAFGISGGVGDGMRRLLMSHPPLADRIDALRRLPT